MSINTKLENLQSDSEYVIKFVKHRLPGENTSYKEFSDIIEIKVIRKLENSIKLRIFYDNKQIEKWFDIKTSIYLYDRL